jgi:2-succinyl-6-hydroxy-2,4-cyclohexadiene-1-carboxylate synthase
MKNQTSKIPVIFLHGFTGSSDDWLPLVEELETVCEPISINLVGHGISEPPQDISEYTIDAQVDRILKIVTDGFIEKFVLVGYSMGGRIALSFAYRYPHRLTGLILESATAGIEDEVDRKMRIESDEELARFIESNEIEVFVERWMNLPLFNSQNRMPAEELTRLKTRKLRNSRMALANSLRVAGTGHMTPLWKELPNLSVPVVLITGSLDNKFTQINGKIATLIPECKHIIVDDAGHAVHFERPEVYYKIIKDFITNGVEKH